MNDQFFERIRSTTLLFSKAKALRVRNENLRKIVKAELMNEARDNGIKTVVAQENYAYPHPSFNKIANELADSIEAETQNFWELRTFEMEMEYWRTSQATKRAEMNLI
jgi:hypothetical protein